MAKDLAESQDSSICLIESNESEEYCATSDLLLSSQGDSFPLHSLNDGIGSKSPQSSLHLQESDLEEQLFGPTPPPSDNGADVGGGCGEADPPPFDIDSVSVVDVVVAGDEPKYGDDDPSVVDVAPLGLGPRRPADLVIELPFGSITFYAERMEFVATCTNVERHGHRCRLTRGSQPSIRTGREGQGRPLGLLTAWLLRSFDVEFSDRAEHVRMMLPCLAERVAGRPTVYS